MLNMALRFERAFERFKNDDCNFENELKENVPIKKDWENARVLARFLEQFYEAKGCLALCMSPLICIFMTCWAYLLTC